MSIDLRAVRDSDLAVFFAHQSDAGAAEMVGFVSRPRAAFDAHWRRILDDPACSVMTVEVDGDVAGYVTSFARDGRREIAYWFGREYWGRGIGRSAVSRFLARHAERPVFAIVAETNPASLAVLRHCGFVPVDGGAGPDGSGERVLRLDLSMDAAAGQGA